MDTYNLNGGKLELKDIRHFPVWYKERGLPKAYTQLQQYNDSLFVGISFMPREIVVELIDTNNECIRELLIFLSNRPLHHIQDRLSAKYQYRLLTWQ